MTSSGTTSNGWSSSTAEPLKINLPANLSLKPPNRSARTSIAVLHAPAEVAKASDHIKQITFARQLSYSHSSVLIRSFGSIALGHLPGFIYLRSCHPVFLRTEFVPGN